MGKKRKKLRGKVEKVIPSKHPTQPEKAQIELHDAEDLYREIRIENVLTDEVGNKDRLKTGDDVDVTIEKDSDE